MSGSRLEAAPSAAGSAAPQGRWPAALLVALALFFLCEHLVWGAERLLRFVDRYKSPSRVGDPFVPTTAGLMSPPDVRPAVILLGSSQVREGLDCGVFEARLAGRPCRNMALSAGTPLDILYVDRSLDEAGPRRTTVTGLFPGMFQTEPKRSFTDLETVRCLVFSGSWRHLTPDDWTDLTFGLIASGSPTLRHKDALWDVFRRLGRGDIGKAWRGGLPPSPERAMAQREPHPPLYFEERMGVVNPNVAPSRFTPAHEEALDQLIARERSRGNSVWIVDFPTRPGYETTITPEATVHYRALLDRLRKRSDVVLLTGPDLPPLGVGDFLDFTHLAESGRQKVSERLAELVAARESGVSRTPGR